MSGPKVITVRDGETINSVVRRLRNCVEKNVVLVSDGADELFLNDVNLKLIQYYACEDGKQIAIESPNPRIRRISLDSGNPRVSAPSAPEPGLRTERSLVQNAAVASEEATAPAKPAVPSGTGPSFRLWWMIPILILGLSAAWFILWASPSVTVVVRPAVKQMVTDVQVEAIVTQEKPELKTRRLPAIPLDRRGEVLFTMPTTGRATIGYAPSRGVVTFVNEEPSPVPVPKGTVVGTQSGIQFVTAKDIVVPRRTVEYFAGVPAGLKAGRAEVEVECAEKGSAGNVSAHRIQVIQGALSGKLRVVNPEPTFGGGDRQIRVVSAEDLSRAKDEARNQALVAAGGELARLAGNQRYLFEELIRVDVESVQPSRKMGEEAAEISLRAVYRANAIAVDRDALAKLLAGYIADTLPASFALVGDNVRLLEVTASPRGLWGALLHATVESRLFGVVSRSRMISGLRGKTLEEARQFLGSIEEVGQYSIKAPRRSRLPKWGALMRVVVVEPS